MLHLLICFEENNVDIALSGTQSQEQEGKHSSKPERIEGKYPFKSKDSKPNKIEKIWE